MEIVRGDEKSIAVVIHDSDTPMELNILTTVDIEGEAMLCVIIFVKLKLFEITVSDCVLYINKEEVFSINCVVRSDLVSEVLELVLNV